MATPGFELIKKQEIKEYNSTAFFYRHVKTGAELLSFVNDDDNKVFGITFRTPPEDSTGIAHILEHSVLCGSRKYPVKEPFVELLKSSLQTFLNAMTYPDKTCYPVASQNLQDFYNLIDVYLDAVFYPRISPMILEQEGWHYELDKADDPLGIKGVVYNEMKGAYSSPDNILMRYSQQTLFPDNTYGLDSGGDPKDIPLLTYEKFFDFHRKYYHPSNSKIFFYGNDNPEERLRLINDYLKEFERIDVNSGIGLQKKFDSPKKINIPFVAETEEGKSPKGIVTVNWLLGESTDIKNNFALQIVNYILLGMPASPLKKALIESGLGEGLAGVGLENELRQMYFSAGLKGIAPADAERVEELIIKTLHDLSANGIDPLTVEAALNTVEFAFRENNTGSYPRGLSLMLRSLTTWLYESDPFALIAFEDPLEYIKTSYASNPSFFSGLIDSFLLKNTHRTTVILNPDPELGERERTFEETRLEQIKNSTNRDNILQIIENTKKLKKMQETPDPEEALASIPCLKLTEIDKENKIIPAAIEQKAVNLYYHDIFTNGILYFDIGLNVKALPQKYLPYMMVFGKALLEMGTDKEDYTAFSQRINRKTGGIGRSYFLSMIKDEKEPAAWMFFRGKALPRQFDDLLAIMTDILLSVKLDNPARFKQIVLETKSALEQALIPGGNKFVNLRIQADCNKAAWAEEEMSGVSLLFFLRALAERIERNWPDVLSDLLEIRRILVSRENMIINVTTDGKTWKSSEGRIVKIVESVPSTNVSIVAWSSSNPRESEGLVIPSLVNYVGKGADLYKAGYVYNGSVNVITRFLRTTYLWERVRVQGGAYGSMCQFNRMSGALAFVSYRDPNLKKTLDVYDNASLFLKNIELSKAELEKSIIGAIGDIDSYMLPDAMGYTSLLRTLNGNTDTDRQRMRDEVLGTSVSDFKAFAECLDYVREKGVVKILGGQNAIEEAYEGAEGLRIVKVL